MGAAKETTAKSAMVFRRHSAKVRIHELRCEPEKKEGGLGVQNLSHDSLAKRMTRRRSHCGYFHGQISRANHPNTEEYQVDCTRIFQDGKRNSGGGDDCGDADRSSQHVSGSANEGACRREQASPRTPVRVREST